MASDFAGIDGKRHLNFASMEAVLGERIYSGKKQVRRQRCALRHRCSSYCVWGDLIISCVWFVFWQLCVKWRTGSQTWEPVDSVAPELVKAFRDRQRQAEASTAEPAQELALKSKRGREDDE